MMTVDTLSDILMKHLQGTLSESEQQQLTQWISQSEQNLRLFESVNDEEQLRQLVLSLPPQEEEQNEAAILSKIRKGIGANHTTIPVRKISALSRWGWVAASALLLAGTGSYLLMNRKKEMLPVAAAKSADIPPGKDGAILTLADGRKVVLDSLQDGVIATQNGMQLFLKNGELSYATGENIGVPLYNILTTPKGRQFQLSLPDGTKVWLNAASSLRYPTIFSDASRKVEVTGEVYFEVAAQGKPFIVNVNNRAEIQVLGTQFNVNAYTNESTIRTTLVKGSVKVLSGIPSAEESFQGPAALLRPGQQAQISNTGNESPVKVLNNADVDNALAWKNGLFNFENASLDEVMRQLERWYDIEVVYEKNVPNIQFGGKLSSELSLSGVLKSLKDSEVRFRLEGRKLIVLP